jgi:hypothetical protein
MQPKLLKLDRDSDRIGRNGAGRISCKNKKCNRSFFGMLDAFFVESGFNRKPVVPFRNVLFNN